MEKTESGHRLKQLRRLLSVVGVCGVLVVALSVMPASASSHAQQIGQRWCDAWDSHSVDRVLAVFTDDVFFEDVTFGLTARGSAQLRDLAQGFFTAVPDFHLDCTATVLHGGQGDIEWVFSGTDVGLFNTGKRFSVRGTSIIEVHESQISRESDYYDLATVMRQVGKL